MDGFAPDRHIHRSAPAVAPLPPARGPLTQRLFEAWRVGDSPSIDDLDIRDLSPDDEDGQLALYCCHELSYGGFADAPGHLESDACVFWIREQLGHALERWMRALRLPPERETLAASIEQVIAQGRSVAKHLASDPSPERVQRLLVLKSCYHLKEADPHTFLIPRLRDPRLRRIVAEVQAGEYGVGHRHTHAELYAHAMEAAGLDATPNRYLGEIPAAWLAIPNVLSVCASRSRLRWWSVGQLAMFEMDSVKPNAILADTISALRFPSAVSRFFALHVLADEAHETLMRRALALVPDACSAGDAINGAVALQRVLDAAADDWEATYGAILPTQMSLGSSAVRPGARPTA